MGRVIKRILLAEDDRGTAHFVKRRLESEGYQVLTAENGRVALELIRSTAVDLLVTDVVMPVMDGVDLYLALKADPATASLPVIIVTDQQMFQDSFSALGVHHFVAKPSDISVLLTKIREIGSLDLEVKQYRKILICGEDQSTVEQMQELLQARGCLVTIVENPMEIVSSALVMGAHVILLDVMIRGDVALEEVVRSLRCYRRLHTAAILTFKPAPAEESDAEPGWRVELQHRIELCQSAGATKYLGQFAPVSFFEILKEFGVS